MFSGIAFLTFLVCWFLIPLVWFYKRWRSLKVAELIIAVFVVAVFEFLLFMILAFMDAITYNGIFNWRFWFS